MFDKYLNQIQFTEQGYAWIRRESSMEQLNANTVVLEDVVRVKLFLGSPELFEWRPTGRFTHQRQYQ